MILVVNFTRFLVTRDRQTDRQIHTIYPRFFDHASHYLSNLLVIQNRRTDKQLITIFNKRTTSTVSHKLIHAVSPRQCNNTQIKVSLDLDFFPVLSVAPILIVKTVIFPSRIFLTNWVCAFFENPFSYTSFATTQTTLRFQTLLSKTFCAIF